MGTHGHARVQVHLPNRDMFVAWLLAPVAWLVHLGASYLIVTLRCVDAWNESAVAITLIAVTLLLAAISLYVGLHSWRRMRALGIPADPGIALSKDFGMDGLSMAIGVITGGLFLLLIVMNGVTPFFVPTCATGMG